MRTTLGLLAAFALGAIAMATAVNLIINLPDEQHVAQHSEVKSNEPESLPDKYLNRISLTPSNRAGDDWVVYNGTSWKLTRISIEVEGWERNEERDRYDLDSYVNQGKMNIEVAQARLEAERMSETPTFSRYYELAVVEGGEQYCDARVIGPLSLSKSRFKYRVFGAMGVAPNTTEFDSQSIIGEALNSLGEPPKQRGEWKHWAYP